MTTFYVKIRLPNTKEISKSDVDFLINANNIEGALIDAIDYVEQTLNIKQDARIVEVREVLDEE